MVDWNQGNPLSVAAMRLTSNSKKNFLMFKALYEQLKNFYGIYIPLNACNFAPELQFLLVVAQFPVDRWAHFGDGLGSAKCCRFPENF